MPTYIPLYPSPHHQKLQYPLCTPRECAGLQSRINVFLALPLHLNEVICLFNPSEPLFTAKNYRKSTTQGTDFHYTASPCLPVAWWIHPCRRRNIMAVLGMLVSTRSSRCHQCEKSPLCPTCVQKTLPSVCFLTDQQLPFPKIPILKEKVRKSRKATQNKRKVSAWLYMIHQKR